MYLGQNYIFNYRNIQVTESRTKKNNPSIWHKQTVLPTLLKRLD